MLDAVIQFAHRYRPLAVETLVAFPIQSAMPGAAGVEGVRTPSEFGRSAVTVGFGWGTDIKSAKEVDGSVSGTAGGKNDSGGFVRRPKT